MVDVGEQLEELLTAFAAALGERLGGKLTCVVVVGPVARALVAAGDTPVPRPGQLHVLLVGDELPRSRWDRHDVAYEALLEIQPERDRFAEITGWWPYLRIYMKTPAELKASGGLAVALDAGVWPVVDKDGLFGDWLERIRARSEGGPVRALGRGNRLYWDVVPDSVAGEEAPPSYLGLARSLLRQAEARMLTTRLALEGGNFPYVVRAAQEAVELSLKAMLTSVGIDPPVWHDVGREVREQAARFGNLEAGVLDELAAISSKLREHREPAVFGDDLDKLPPERLFSEYDARISRDWARQVFEIALAIINEKTVPG